MCHRIFAVWREKKAAEAGKALRIGHGPDRGTRKSLTLKIGRVPFS